MRLASVVLFAILCSSQLSVGQTRGHEWHWKAGRENGETAWDLVVDHRHRAVIIQRRSDLKGVYYSLYMRLGQDNFVTEEFDQLIAATEYAEKLATRPEQNSGTYIGLSTQSQQKAPRTSER